MKVNFVTMANKGIASYRYHAMIPARELERLGHHCVISPEPAMGVDVYVFSKHWNYGDYWYMRGVQADGKKAVFHVCDDHFNTPHRGHYLRMIKGADVVLASTVIMRERIIGATRRENVVLVRDSIDMPTAAPRFALNGSGRKIRLFWYGHHSNLDALIDMMPLGEEYELRISTTPGIGLPSSLAGADVRPWSMQEVATGLDWCDAVIIPVRNEIQKLSKSHNRVTEAINAGRYVIANALNSYEVYRGTIYIGDIKEGLEDMRQLRPEDILKRIADAQKIALDNYAPQIIGNVWEEVLNGSHS